MQKLIGIHNQGYPVRRNISFYSNNHIFSKNINLLTPIVKLLYFLKIRGGFYYFFKNTFIDIFPNKSIGYHFFNSIYIGKKPWIVTYESTLPRWFNKNIYLKYLHHIFEKDNCRQIIAISENAKNIFLADLVSNQCSIEKIENKLSVIHPPQKLIFDGKNKIEQKSINSFVIVGNHFYRKGGFECLKAFETLFDQGIINWSFTVISTLEKDPYSNDTIISETRQLFVKMKSNITHLTNVKNEEVLQILLKSEIAVLPTYSDTYGYFVLEAQACGCPVITTNVRALPEINNNNIGWLIEVPKDGYGNLNIEIGREHLSELLTNKLSDILMEIILGNEKDNINKKRNNCLRNIQINHNPDKIAKELNSYYDEFNNCF